MVLSTGVSPASRKKLSVSSWRERPERCVGRRSSLLDDRPQDLLDGGDTLSRLDEAVFSKRYRAGLLRSAAYFARRYALQDQIAYIFVHYHHLVDAYASPVSRPSAPVATHRLMEISPPLTEEREGKPKLAESLLLHLNWPLASLAQLPCQPLSDDAVNR